MSNAPKPVGLRYWMLRVLQECDRVAVDFRADPVHDLRVSLRRCRSLADGMTALDPDPNWKSMKKGGRQLFQRLGALRDVQIMMEWIDKLYPGNEPRQSTEAVTLEGGSSELLITGTPQNRGDAVARALHVILKGRESEFANESRIALAEFDRKQWLHWSKSLPIRAARIRPGSGVFKHLALERWTTARELHVRALRSRSKVALHTLRIGIKRFRYIVENFLPAEHESWGDDLKHLQDLLGDVHDLDVLWATAISCRVFSDKAARDVWHARILEKRKTRIQKYREKTTGAQSLWVIWRAGLPQGRQVFDMATQRMKLWAKALDPDFAHAERVSRLALELYDGLSSTGWLGRASIRGAGTNGSGDDDRASLYAAALLHDVGKVKGNKGHHKQSEKLIQKHGAPLGWRPENIERAARVARFHRGALPQRNHKALRDLLPDEQRTIIRLSAILRLANALDCSHDGRVRRVRIENPADTPRRRINRFLREHPMLKRGQALVIAAEGFADGTPIAQAVAAERYLLESVLHRPVMVKPLRAPRARNSPGTS